ncbi:hypothetical protein, conserved [Babesia ovata]|uniref:Extracellular matrix-binding ebh n=1 Tax=Babesia ovata TaxID=189622 RepID=A0A2H6KKH5_9APIC|nr:uncharacterized protein BOVATA_049840 [Babesia ovata]GBE63491.1 hypothetical protein, conserved [Babesia ovata]
MTGKALDDIDAHRISLGQLAGQLSDFIGGGEEVKKAILNGLHSNVTQLEKLVKTSCGDKGCCKDAVNFRVGPLKNLQEQFNDIDKIEREIDGLKNEIAEKRKASEGTPPGSDTEIQKLTREIEEKKLKLDEQKRLVDQQINNLNGALNEFNKKFSRQVSTLTASVRQCEEEIERYKESEKASKKDLKDADISIPYNLSHPLETEQAKLQSHNASLESLESLEKLITFHEEVSKNPKTEECKNILTNLCSGLEKFLGYQETSKGYSGSGIVYSDLDRLCDGVMAFLHGVLQSVKGDENVTTYDKYINEEENKLSNVLQHLQSSIGSGRVGLSASVTKVREWLGKYNEEVDRKTRGVTDGLSALIGKLHDGSNSVSGVHYYKMVEGEATKDLGTQLSDWTTTVGMIQDEVNNIQNSNINDLDSALKAQITHKIEPVKKVVEHLKGVAEKMAEGGKVGEVDSTITEKETLVKEQIRIKAEELRGTLKQNLDDINGRIDAIETQRTTTLKALKDSVQQLENAVTAADAAAIKLDEEYENEIVKKLEEINPKVQALGTEKIANDLSSVYSAISSQLEKLKARLEAFGGLGATVQGEVDNALIHIKIFLHNEISSLKGQLKGKLKTYAEEYIRLVRQQVEGIRVAMDMVDTKKGGSTNSSPLRSRAIEAQTNITGLNGELDKAANEIGKSIHNAVHEANRGLGSLETTILNELEQAIKGKISQQLSAMSSSGGYSVGNGYGGIGNGVEFAKGMSYGMSQAKSSALTAAAAAIGDIKQNFANVFRNVNAQIKGADGNDDTLKKKIEKIETGVKMFFNNGTGITGRSDGFNLLKDGQFGKYKSQKDKAESAIGLVLKQIGKLEEVYPKVKDLDDQLGKALTGAVGIPGDKVKVEDSVDARVDEKIKAADPQLDELLKKAVKKGITMLNKEVTHIHSQLTGVEPTIRPQIDKLNKVPSGGSPGAIQAQISDLQKQIDELKKLVSGVNNKARSTIKTQVTSLKEQVAQILAGITKINSAIEEFDRALKSAIQQAQQAAKAARKELGDLIGTTETELTKAAKAAFEAVHTAVKTMFAEGHKADLAQLKELVSAQNAAITDIIEKDKKNGLKGLMAKMYETGGDKLNELKNYNDPKIPAHFKDLSDKLKDYLKLIFDYISAQVKTTSSSPTKEPTKMLGEVQGKLETLLGNLSTSKHFDNVFVTHLESYSSEHNTFTPSQFAGPDNALLLDVLQEGLQRLRDQLDRAYVSAYSGDYWNNNNKDKCANVFCTIMHTFYRDLRVLRDGLTSGAWYHKNIYLSDSNPLGAFFKNCDYGVSKTADTQNGELRNTIDGKTILGFLHQANKIFNSNFYKGPAIDLHRHIRTYYTACHLTLHDSPRYPSTVRDMLSWLTGLPYTAVYQGIKTHCDTLLKKEITDAEKKSQPADPVISNILRDELRDNLDKTCKISYDLLTTLQGHGNGFDQAEYRYASNFRDNCQKFYYPTNVSSLFAMLTELCTRLLYSLYFVYSRCRTPSKYNGWSDCTYGNAVQGYQSNCNIASHTGKDCDPKSLLQSHLMDRLPGFLPHSLSSNGNSLSCNTCRTAPRGTPCVTPMGFWDMTTAASVTKNGNAICEVLKGLCKNADSPLPRLLRSLMFICPTAPKNLADLFSVFCNVMQIFKDSKYAHNSEYKTTLDVAINNCFPSSYTKLFHNDYSATNLTDKLRDLYCSRNEHPDQLLDATHHGLQSLSPNPMSDKSEQCSLKLATCAPYLQALGSHAHHTYAPKHAALYVSWCSYLVWEFWQLLDSLLKAFNNMSCKTYGCSCNCPPETWPFETTQPELPLLFDR